MKSSKIFFFICFILLFLGTFCQSETTTIPFTLRPITTGPVALSLGGSSIVNIDDPYLAIQNPSKLSLMTNSQLTLGLYSSMYKESLHFDNPHFSGSKGPTDNEFKVNYLGYCTPFRLFSMNMAAGISYYPLYTFERSISFHQNDNTQMTDQRQWNINQKGYISAISMSYALKLHSNWSFGLSWNWVHEGFFDNQLQQEISMTGHLNHPIQFDEYVSQCITHEYSGSYLDFGLMWIVSSRLKAGAVFQTRLKNSIISNRDKKECFNGNIMNSSTLVSDADHFEIPMSWGIGFCYSFIDNWNILFDFRQIFWRQADQPNASEANQYLSKNTESNQDLNVHMVHLGSIYQAKHDIGGVVPIFRMGVSFCTNRGMIHPEPDESIGFGFGLVGKRLEINTGYQYQRYEDITQNSELAGLLRSRIRNNVIQVSLTYRFTK